MTKTRALDIFYDTSTDIVTIEGKRYSGDFFRTLAVGPVPNRLLRVVKSRDAQAIDLEHFPVDMKAFLTWYKQQRRRK